VAIPPSGNKDPEIRYFFLPAEPQIILKPILSNVCGVYLFIILTTIFPISSVSPSKGKMRLAE